MVHQCTQLIADTKLPHNQAVHHVLNYLKGTTQQGLILKPDPVKTIKCYVDSDFAVGWNQQESKDPAFSYPEWAT